MYGLNGFALLVFGAVNVLAAQLCRTPEKRRAQILRALCAVLLLGNLARYTAITLTEPGIKVPVEFSAVAYFVTPALLLFTKKAARSWAAYAGLMAGFFYYLTLMLVGGRIYDAYAPSEVYFSMFCHGSVYLCGMTLIGTQRRPSHECYQLAVGIGLVIVNALVLRPVADGRERLFIYELLDAKIVHLLLPENVWAVATPIYYVLMAALVLVSFWGFYKNSDRMYRRVAAAQPSV